MQWCSMKRGSPPLLLLNGVNGVTENNKRKICQPLANERLYHAPHSLTASAQSPNLFQRGLGQLEQSNVHCYYILLRLNVQQCARRGS
jgi:hypothetical protein